MILEELKELKVFVLKETDLRSVNIIHFPDASGYRALIEHGNEELYDGKPLVANLPVTVKISDTIENYEKVLKGAEILRKEIREQKSHKWNAGPIERVESATEYTLIVNLTMPLPIS